MENMKNPQVSKQVIIPRLSAACQQMSAAISMKVPWIVQLTRFQGLFSYTLRACEVIEYLEGEN
jgi:hypothetical protein